MSTSRQPPPPRSIPPVETPACRASSIRAVHSALCLAGCARSKGWLLNFLNELDWTDESGQRFKAAEVDLALSRLQSEQLVNQVLGVGFDVPEDDREAWLISNFDADTAEKAWKAWLRAQSPQAARYAPTPAPHFRDQGEAIALARLLVYSGIDRTQFEAQRYHLGLPDDRQIAIAAMTPFIADAFLRIDPRLANDLLDRWPRKFDLGTELWRELLDWLDRQVTGRDRGDDQRPLPPAAILAVARRRAQSGDAAAALEAIRDIDLPETGEVLATIAAVDGRWADAAEGFKATRKLIARERGGRLHLLGHESMRWQLLSMLAQDDPGEWSAARKLCLSESGSRNPRPDGWGLWAHAIGHRLGEDRLIPRSFAGPLARGGYLTDDDPDRLLLAAWLGLQPEAWAIDDYQGLIDRFDGLRQHCRADLLREAVIRLGLEPASLPAGRSLRAPPFFTVRQEPWREALAAIARIVPGQAAAAMTHAQPPTLAWAIDLDEIGRIIDIRPHEHSTSARGRTRLKEITLARVARSQTLDPRDAAVARSIESMRRGRSSYGIDVATAAMALIGHPAVVLGDAPDDAIALRESLPELEVRRTASTDGTEAFEFHLLDPIRESSMPILGDRWTAPNPETEIIRRNSIRIVPGLDGEARVIRITPAQRQVAELIARRWTVPIEAKAELDAALRALAGHFQLQSDAEAGNVVACDSRLRAQLTPRGDAMQLRLVVRPFGDYGPLLAPGAGRERTLTLHEGMELSTRRDLDAERRHLDQVIEALPFLADDRQADSIWLLADAEDALEVIETLPKLPCVAGIEWPRGKPLRVRSLAPSGLKLTVTSSADWFEVQGQVTVDDSRVLRLQTLIRMIRDNGTRRFIALGEGEYLALTERLRSQLADLAAIAAPGDDTLRLPRAAAAFAQTALDGLDADADAEWLAGAQRLQQAAALDVRVPAGLQAELRDYQRDGYQWMSRMAHAGLGAILADDMGLGKTVQTLALLLARASAGPALVVAPTSVCGNWILEARRFAPSLRVVAFGDGDRAATLEGTGPGDVVVASYGLTMIESEAFSEREWATLVLDEAQMLKNAATQRGRAIASLRAGFRLALSGTPVENRLADLWSIMNLLNPGLLGSSGQFSERFAAPIERQRDEAARTRLRRLISPFLLRRTKAQVLADLPERTEIVHRIEPAPREREFLEAMRRSALEHIEGLDGDESQQSFHVLAELTRLRRAACDPRLVAPDLGLIGEKVQEFERLARELTAGRHKALVFSQFTDFLDLLGERLQQAGIAFHTLTGSTPAAERTRRVSAFQAGDGNLFLISLKAGGFGLNLTAADYVIIVDPWWNPAAEDQASGRAHRIGQQRPVTVYRLVTAGSIEEQIIDLHHRKRDLADGVLQGQDTGTVISPAELRTLLAGGER